MTAGDVLFALAALALGAGVGVVVGYRRGVAATWLTAARALVWATRVVHLQLARLERAEVDRQEVEHAHRYGEPGRMPSNRAGYRSPANLNNSPTRTGVGPTVQIQREVTR